MKKRMICLALGLTLCLGLCPARAVKEETVSALITLNGAVVSGPLTAEETPGAWCWRGWHYNMGDLSQLFYYLHWVVPEERREWAETMAWVPALLTLDGVEIQGNLAYNDEWPVFSGPVLTFYTDVSDDRVVTLMADRSRFPEGTGFADVDIHDWFAPYVQVCVEYGLMQGTDRGFEPGKALTVGECAAIAARLRESLTGEAVPASTPGNPWFYPYVEYMRTVQPTLTPVLAHADDECNRYMFLRLLNAAISGREELLEPIINEVTVLPDSGDEMVLGFYNAGILTGTDKYGTFEPYKSLTRAEAAAMITRIVEPSSRLPFTPADYSPFLAAHMEPGTVVFETGITAERFLSEVNNAIFRAEERLKRSGTGEEFNWHRMETDDGTGRTTLERAKAEVLEILGVTEKQGTQSYKDFDYQVYYSRLIDLTGETLEPDYAVGVGS